MARTNKYPVRCCRCGETVPAGGGQAWRWQGRWYGAHAECSGARRHSREDYEYAMGRADGERYIAEKRIYGEAMAERFAMEDELARWNRGDD